MPNRQRPPVNRVPRSDRKQQPPKKATPQAAKPLSPAQRKDRWRQEHHRNKTDYMARLLHDILAESDYENESLDDLIEALRLRGADLDEWANTTGKTLIELKERIQREELRKFLRTYKERGNRVIRFT